MYDGRENDGVWGAMGSLTHFHNLFRLIKHEMESRPKLGTGL